MSDAASLIAIRQGLDHMPAVMANRLGMSLRPYQEIQNGRAPCRRIHILAAERVALEGAVDAQGIAAAPAVISR